MKNVLFLSVLLLSSCANSGEDGRPEFRAKAIQKRVQYEQQVSECMDGFSDQKIKQLFDRLSDDSSFLALQANEGGKWYYSGRSYRSWNFTTYPFYDESVKSDRTTVSYSLGALTPGGPSRGPAQASVSTSPTGPGKIDSVLLVAYGEDELWPSIRIFFNYPKIPRVTTIPGNGQVHATGSGYSTGTYILVDSLSSR